MISRREFVSRGGALLAAMKLRSPAGSHLASHDSLSRIGLQLYTVRGEMQKSVDETLAHVARIGYKEVEFAGYFQKTPKEIRAILDANGLQSPSSHSADFPTMRERWPETLEGARVMGHRYVLCASLPRRESRTADDYRKVAALLNEKGAQARQAGLTLGYHNHDAEFRSLGSAIGYDILLAECDPTLVRMQLDLYWIVNGGKDPLEYFARYPGRFFSVHVKDMAADGQMADVGAGRLPFARYLAAARKAGVIYHFVEHDHPADPWISVTSSLNYLRRLKF